MAEPAKHSNQLNEPTKRPPFESKDHTQISQRNPLPNELWLAVLECPCTFPPEIFNAVMLNLVKNPNITSSHLFRADIFYDSEQDHHFKPEDSSDPYQGFTKHVKAEYKPIPAQWPGVHLERTMVRQLVPRNPQLDKPLVQTCHFFRKQDEQEESSLVLYIPHVQNPEDMPFYHPAVSQLAFLHTWKTVIQPEHQPGLLTLLYRPFPDDEPISTKLSRTALKLLQTIHKHGQGQLAGYKKRVHHDQIIPQKRYQDTYTRLKMKYGRQLSEKWIEVTDPGKHVFEDIGIAAFLIEVWRDMYRLPTSTSTNPNTTNGEMNSHIVIAESNDNDKPPFPGFIDIGCGNGLLTSLLLSEGYPGSGFDARNRKTWSIFPPEIQSHLEQKILVPSIFQSSVVDAAAATQSIRNDNPLWHDGLFPQRGTFIISNHADELTAWTPFLAYLNDSAFMAIPCCSHDLTGARFRAPQSTKAAKEAQQDSRLPQQQQQQQQQQASNDDQETLKDGGNAREKNNAQAAETGSLKRTETQKKMLSAYSTLCSYVSSLAEEVGFEPEQDTLRIPSTRNACILGRQRPRKSGPESAEEKAVFLTELVEREIKRPITSVAADWIERAEKLMKKPGSGH